MITYAILLSYFGDTQTTNNFCENIYWDTRYNYHFEEACEVSWEETYNYNQD